ncbi:GreA/GreB family elongation factor [Winogradskyella poriferorum]|uniref:GreA/GreB family elongation factor n=1 Tax=Winogradskyella poriferorum TaxID=307627 RepID=UPI003D64EC96
MKYGSLILEKKEYVYLKRILNISGYAEDHERQECLMKLFEELKSAHILNNDQMPDDVVRFNSTVTVAYENGVKKTVQVVIPSERDFRNNKISVLTPLGSALIGYSKDDSVIWSFPQGNEEIHISEVKQERELDKTNFSI